jgi:hypothetical protein
VYDMGKTTLCREVLSLLMSSALMRQNGICRNRTLQPNPDFAIDWWSSRCNDQGNREAPSREDGIEYVRPNVHALISLAQNWRQKLDYDGLPRIKAWGLSVKPQMMTVNARVLPSPMITYGASKTLRVQRG